MQHMVGFSAPVFPGSAYIPALFGTAVYFYGGLVFVKGGLRELRDRLPGMMTLISLAITVAFVFSLAVTLGYPGEALWWELASLVTIMLLGHWIEMRSISQASGALRELARLLPSTAQRIVGETIEDVAVSALREGDLVLVRPGASVPADGIVQSGKSDVNESMITGESVPVPKVEGVKVIAGTVNGSGSLRVTVTGTGERTALANIMRLVEQAQTSRSRAQALADRAAFLLTIIAVVTGALTLIVWLAVGATGAFAVERLVSVLVIACPHALGLAVPLVAAISTSLGAQSGLLVRDRRGLEEARNLTTVVFDKTGTLTRGEFRVVDVATDGSLSADDALRIAAAVERDSEHTIAQGIVKSAEEQALSVPKAEQFEAIPGHGVRAVVEGKEFYMGGPAMLKRLARNAVSRRARSRRAGGGAGAGLHLPPDVEGCRRSVHDRGRRAAGVSRGHSAAPCTTDRSRDADRRCQGGRGCGGRQSWNRHRLRRGPSGRQSRQDQGAQGPGNESRWWVMASTTRPHCSRRTSPSPSARARMSQSKRVMWCWSERPARRAANHCTEPSQLSQDDAEPLVGGRI